MTPVGFIVYRGPSLIEPGVEIALVVNCVKGQSNNEKTGPLAQSWIIRTDMHPMDAIRSDMDTAICGRCPYAGGKGCYVSMQPISSVWRTMKAGRYAPETPEAVAAELVKALKKGTIRGLRCGSYGDPAAVPADVWLPLVEAVRQNGGKTTGYTHQWSADYSNPGYIADPRLRGFLMASAHGAEDAKRANGLGWRSFATFRSVEELRASIRIVACPASPEGGERRSCSTCGVAGMCSGKKTDEDRRADVGIVVHGTGYVRNRALKANTGLMRVAVEAAGT